MAGSKSANFSLTREASYPIAAVEPSSAAVPAVARAAAKRKLVCHAARRTFNLMLIPAPYKPVLINPECQVNSRLFVASLRQACESFYYTDTVYDIGLWSHQKASPT